MTSDWPLVAPADPRIEYEPGPDRWVVREAYTVRDPASGRRLDVPAAFECDGASVPRALWVAIGKHELGTLGPVSHDRIYRARRCNRFTRGEADKLFLTLMLHQGVHAWKARAAYAAVRAFGWLHWRRHA